MGRGNRSLNSKNVLFKGALRGAPSSRFSEEQLQTALEEYLTSDDDITAEYLVYAMAEEAGIELSPEQEKAALKAYLEIESDDPREIVEHTLKAATA